MNERVNETIIISEYQFKTFNATKTGNGFNKIMKTGNAGNGFNKVNIYIVPSKQERKILFEATRTCVWLKLDVCGMCVTQITPASG